MIIKIQPEHNALQRDIIAYLNEHGGNNPVQYGHQLIKEAMDSFCYPGITTYDDARKFIAKYQSEIEECIEELHEIDGNWGFLFWSRERFSISFTFNAFYMCQAMTVYEQTLFRLLDEEENDD